MNGEYFSVLCLYFHLRIRVAGPPLQKRFWSGSEQGFQHRVRGGAVHALTNLSKSCLMSISFFNFSNFHLLDHLKKFEVDGRLDKWGGMPLVWRSTSGNVADSLCTAGRGEAPRGLCNLYKVTMRWLDNLFSFSVFGTWAGAKTAMDIGPDQVLASSTSWSNLENGFYKLFL